MSPYFDLAVNSFASYFMVNFSGDYMKIIMINSDLYNHHLVLFISRICQFFALLFNYLILYVVCIFLLDKIPQEKRDNIAKWKQIYQKILPYISFLSLINEYPAIVISVLMGFLLLPLKRSVYTLFFMMTICYLYDLWYFF